MVFRYDPPGAPPAPVLGLVGKGITFDTGGISIKPADGMERMKDDMAGGAAVACAMRAIALLKAPIRVIGIVPTTENMPGGRAIKPGDMLKSAQGKTVEVINTDAEGPADSRRRAVVRAAARRDAPGRRRDAHRRRRRRARQDHERPVRHAGGVGGAGARGRPIAPAIASWPMPLFDEYRDQIKSDIADFMNTGGRPAGSITAAMFLKEFTGGLPWAHMDIAGTAWAEEAEAVSAEGAERRRRADARRARVHRGR